VAINHGFRSAIVLSPTFGNHRNTYSSGLPATQDKINGSSTLCGEDCMQVTLEAMKEESSPGTDDADDAFDDDDGGDADDDEGI
jgi:hypothetical protein